MLVLIVQNFHVFHEYYCSHPILSEYQGKLRAHGKFLAPEKIIEMKQALDGKFTTFQDTNDEGKYKYVADFVLQAGNEEYDEDFVIEPPSDGRWFTGALIADFVKQFGRKAVPGDVFTSSATIVAA